MQYAVRLCGFFVRSLFPCSLGVFCFSRRTRILPRFRLVKDWTINTHGVRAQNEERGGRRRGAVPYSSTVKRTGWM
jgi:hypothetical protein